MNDSEGKRALQRNSAFRRSLSTQPQFAPATYRAPHCEWGVRYCNRARFSVIQGTSALETINVPSATHELPDYTQAVMGMRECTVKHGITNRDRFQPRLHRRAMEIPTRKSGREGEAQTECRKDIGRRMGFRNSSWFDIMRGRYPRRTTAAIAFASHYPS